MTWVLGVVALLVVGAVTYRILHLDTQSAQPSTLLATLEPEREAIYQPVALEIETQSAILGISLNDAFEERDSGRHAIAWRMVRLSIGEWSRLMDLIEAVLKVVGERLPLASGTVPARGIVAKQFRSEAMVNTVRLHELLDRLLSGSGLRVQIHLRLLRRAARSLTSQFHRAYRSADQTGDRPGELWGMLDLYFHDFDVVAKETLLAFRGLVATVPAPALPEIAEDVKSVVQRGVRATPSPVN